MLFTVTLKLRVLPSGLRLNSAVPVALVFLGGTSSLPVIFAVNFCCCCCAKATDGIVVFRLLLLLRPAILIIIASPKAATSADTGNIFSFDDDDDDDDDMPYLGKNDLKKGICSI